MTKFQEKVYEAVAKMPKGETRTYMRLCTGGQEKGRITEG